MATAAYREHAPGAALAPMVECFWTSTAPAPAGPATHRVLPDGCMDLLFDFTAGARPPVTIVGTMTRALLVARDGPSDLFGIRFRAGGLPALLRLDAAELRDANADPACFGGRFAADLWDRLAEAPAAARAAIARAALPAAPVDPLVAFCAARIEAAGGNIPVSRLEQESGAGARRIERRFARAVGLGPKAFARIVRFRRLVSRAGSAGWADLAADGCYSDQPHMTREFRALAGLSPGRYLAEQAVGFVQDADRPAA